MASKTSKKASARKIPDFVPPMLAVLSARMPPDEAFYGFEYKWDGYRIVCYWDGARMRLRTRNGLDYTSRYPEILPLGPAIGAPAVLDGEMIALDMHGKPSFAALQQRGETASAASAKALSERHPVIYMIFDILYYDGEAMMELPYFERRRLLESLHLDDRSWKTPPYQRGTGSAMLEVARKHGFEGVMAKTLDAAYAPGKRSPHWLKIRNSKRQEFVVAGWTPGEGALRSSLGSLLLGYYDAAGNLRYAGHVGTGLSDELRSSLKGTFRKIALPQSPFSDRVTRRESNFIRPDVVCEVKFTEWTPDAKVRHPVFMGLRFDKDPRTIVREKES